MAQRNVLLYHLDGRLPNMALMRAATHYRRLGHEVELRRTSQIERQLWDRGDELVFASLIFEKTRPLALKLKHEWPGAIIGGTGWDLTTTLEGHGITTDVLDYRIYPGFEQSIGFTQRGCRLKCEFCVVPRKEGRVRPVNTIYEIWREFPAPREIVLLDNDFFGHREWPDRIAELRDGNFKVNFNQGINVRFLTPKTAAAIASVDYRDVRFKRKCMYTAWDNRKDEDRVMRGLNMLKDAGVKPGHIMVYMLIGYWPGETPEDWVYRAKQLRDFGADPYPMPFVRNKQTVGFQRWICGHYDKPSMKREPITWERWVKAGYYPTGLTDAS